MPRSARPDRSQRLHDPALTPEARFDYALSLLPNESRQDVLEAVLALIATAPHDPRVRPALLSAYAKCEHSPGRGDPGCHCRVALLQALRPVARRDDTALLTRAVTTCEFLPPFHPGQGDVAAALRASALVVLNEVDEQLAAYQAARLLSDEYTSPLSGEPAITAAQTLASQGQLLPLYEYAVRPTGTMPEVVAECLRHLAGVPLSVVRPLIDRYLQSPHEIVLLGLFELLLEHPEREIFRPYILEFLRETKLFNLYRWLVSAVLTSRDQELIAAVAALEHAEADPRKLAILRETLALRPEGSGGHGRRR